MLRYSSAQRKSTPNECPSLVGWGTFILAIRKAANSFQEGVTVGGLGSVVL